MVVALYPFQAIEGGDISLEKVHKVVDTILIYLIGFRCGVSRVRNMKSLTILRSIGGKYATNLGEWSQLACSFQGFEITNALIKDRSNGLCSCIHLIIQISNSGIGYIPSNYVKEKELIGLQKYE